MDDSVVWTLHIQVVWTLHIQGDGWKVQRMFECAETALRSLGEELTPKLEDVLFISLHRGVEEIKT